MHAMRQSMRPKHQVLVLKCYPKFQKGVSEVVPNPSELSYLLYYASTRRTKIQKVASFLERKSESDVAKQRTGNVQVTLHIVRALVEKSPRDLPLYAPHVLRIFTLILKSKDLALVEESVPAFEAFCEHEDTTTVQANPALARQFEDVVRGYAAIAQEPPVQSKGTMSAPVAIRWKTAGLLAIKSLTASEAIASDRGRQLNIVMPVILENLAADGEDRLMVLGRKAEGDKDLALKRRMSNATARTGESQTEGKDTVVTNTAAESDRIAEEEAGLIAVQSLKQIFVATTRGQIRLATLALLRYLIDKTVPERPETAVTVKSARPGNWTTSLVEMVTKWTPVQDRFIILTTAVENLIQSPIKEENMEKQLVLATLIEWLLSSNINMIGLSVMDVLLGLVQHILSLLQLSDQVPTSLPHLDQSTAIDLFNKPEDEPGNRSSVLDILNSRSIEEIRPASLAHQQLLSRLRKCIGCLATHIYYSDQVSDIVAAILHRLKPNSSGTAGVDDKTADESKAADSTKKAGSSKPEYFANGTARVTALNAIKDVITVANRRSTLVGAGVVGRNRISVRVWEGTHWLLRDQDKRVRRAYAEALLTWLRLEVTKADFRVHNEMAKVRKRKTVDFNNEKSEAGVTRTPSAVSRHRTKPSTFLPLLHLAIYENALESPETDANIMLLHLLLNNLVLRLGVNAVRTGLPMVRRLQEDINTSALVGTPQAKISIGSLVHGYFWTCYSVFDFETTAPGFEISREIERRKRHGLWLAGVQVPPQNLDMIIASHTSKPSGIAADRAQKESLRPFDHIKSLVEQIAITYDRAVLSPPSSPPSTPGRLSVPKVATPGPSALAAQLPQEFRDAMNTEWTREAAIAAAEKEAARSSSPAGSRSGTTRSQVNGGGGLLAANGAVARDPSPARAAGDNIRLEKASPAMAAAQRLRRQSSGVGAGSSDPATPLSDSSEHGGALRVDDLKRALTGGALGDVFSARPRSAARTESPLRNARSAQYDFGFGFARPPTRPSHLSTTSDSLVDAEGYASASEYGDEGAAAPNRISHEVIEEAEESPVKESAPARSTTTTVVIPHASTTDYAVATPTTPSGEAASASSPRHSRGSGSRPRSGSDVSAEDPEANARALKGQLVPEVVRGSIVADEGIPPVPPLPQNLMGRTSRSSNRMRGEALAPGGGGGGQPFSGPSSGRSSATTPTPHARRGDALGYLPPLTQSTDDATAAAIAAISARSPTTATSRSPPLAPTSPLLAPSGGQKSPALAPAASHNTTRDDRPESLVAAAQANAAGAAAALAAIAAAGGASSDHHHQAYTTRAPGLGLAAHLSSGAGGVPMGRAPSNISSLGDAASIGPGGEVSAVGSRAGSLRDPNSRPGTSGHDGGPRRGSGGAKDSAQRSSLDDRAAHERLLGQAALLGSIEVPSAGGKSIGRPPV